MPHDIPSFQCYLTRKERADMYIQSVGTAIPEASGSYISTIKKPHNNGRII